MKKTDGAICVSVIVPVYNCERYLDRCLQSLCAQTLQNAEFIIIDDGSTDRSARIIDRYAAQDSRFAIIRKENGGVASARNAGLSAARGEYLGFADSDDYAEPDCFELLYRRAKADGADLVICDYFTSYHRKETPAALQLTNGTVDIPHRGYEWFYLGWLAKEITLWNHLFRRSIVEEHGIRFETNRGEDNLFHLRLLPYLRRASWIGKSLYHYVQRESSLTHVKHFDPGNQPPNLMECYLQKPLSQAERGLFPPRMPDYILAALFTGLIFSHGVPGVPVSFFREQLGQMRESPDFTSFCRLLATTGELDNLFRLGAMSRKFYRAERLIFSCCHAGQDRLAAWLMWAVSRLIGYKRRFRRGDLQ